LPGVHVVAYPIDDGWIRDNGPLFVRSSDEIVAINYDFNSWGERFSPSDGDRSVTSKICDVLGVSCVDIQWVLEGGALTFNGEGRAVASAECILNPTRNGSMNAKDAEDVIKPNLGISELTWVPFGLIEDLKNTDGHVDNVAVFISAKRVLVQTCERQNPNFERLNANIEVLSRIRLDDGEPVELVECEWLPYMMMPDGTEQPAPYLNFALSNDAVILPSVESLSDDSATRFFADLFPGRSVIFVPAAALTFGGGGPHCVTMQVPEGVSWPH
jgi:agmatine deiminase